jgi:molecular chaperone DnaK (HSP70)
MLEWIEKARIILSANAEAGINIESLIEDYDLSWSISRTEFEEIIKPNLSNLETLMKECIHDSGLKTSQIHSLEMMGCGTRIPIIMDIAMKVFEKEQVQRTLHSDEAIARGCSL